LWVLALSGLGLVLLCCGGLGGVVILGMNIGEEELANQLRDHPKFREHIGEVEEISFDIVATSALNDEESTVYRVRGNKGSGRLTVQEHLDDQWNTKIDRADLRLKDGTQVQIIP
jgi:hypothetical protein